MSALLALVGLAFISTRLVELPTLQRSFTLLGLLVTLEVNTRLVMLTLAAGLAASGAESLVRAHPRAVGRPAEHWLLPGLAALALGTVIVRLPEGPALWLGFATAILLLLAILSAEFVVVDEEDPRFPWAAAGLKALAYLLLVEVYFTLRALDMRAIFAIPLVFGASAAIPWRMFRLSMHPAEAVRYAPLVGALLAQIAWGLHYWPLAPLKGSLLLGVAAYIAIEGMEGHAARDLPPRQIAIHILLAVAALAAILWLT